MSRIDFRLYVVTDRHQTAGRPLLAILDDATRAGVRAVQLRERDLTTRELLTLAENVQRMLAGRGTRLFINDRIDVVRTLSVSGVHLRESSLPPSVARRLLSPDQFIGVSAHSVAGACAAEAEGADFVVLGPIFETPSKIAYGKPLGLGLLEEAAAAVRIPIFAIGGISPARAREVRRAGAFGVAVISSILSAADVASATRDLLAAVE